MTNSNAIPEDSKPDRRLTIDLDEGTLELVLDGMDRLSERSGGIAKALVQTLESPNELDSNWEAANVVDGLYAIARAIHHLAEATESTSPNPKPIVERGLRPLLANVRPQ